MKVVEIARSNYGARINVIGTCDAKDVNPGEFFNVPVPYIKTVGYFTMGTVRTASFLPVTVRANGWDLETAILIVPGGPAPDLLPGWRATP